jgi:hypothetical protein
LEGFAARPKAANWEVGRRSLKLQNSRDAKNVVVGDRGRRALKAACETVPGKLVGRRPLQGAASRCRPVTGDASHRITSAGLASAAIGWSLTGLSLGSILFEAEFGKSS